MTPLGWPQIFAQMAQALWPTWLALGLLIALSLATRRHTGLYGKLFDSRIGTTGFALVMFWVFTALFASQIAPFDPLAQLSGLKNKPPGSFDPNGSGAYLLGGDALARDVFSRMVAGSAAVLKIAPLATAIAFMVGIALGLPAGYFGGKLDAALTFIANLVLSFPVILLFYLLVTPEILATGIPTTMAAILFAVPLLLALVMINARFHTDPRLRAGLMAAALIFGGWLYAGFAFNADPLGLITLSPNELIVFVSVVFVNAPTVFRITRGLTLDISARDYVAAAQTRGEGPWYIMLWEILPNARGPLIVDFCLRIGYTTILLGTLGFFGLGISPESPNWGATINAGSQLLSIYPHAAVVPALALMSLVLGLNLLADGLREESLRD